MSIVSLTLVLHDYTLGVDYLNNDLNNDLSGNKFRPDLSYNFIDGYPNPQPEPGESHGTMCASVAVGTANNGYCGVGVAPFASYSGIHCFLSLSQKDRTRRDQAPLGLGSQLDARCPKCECSVVSA